MKRGNYLWGLAGFAFTSALGTLFHFLYDLSGEKRWAALISGVNESTWEHMKLLFFPMLFFALIRYFNTEKRKDFWCIQFRSILLGQLLIPVLFYTYNGAVGKSPDWLNISIFFIAAFFAYRFQSKAFQEEKTTCLSPALSFALLCAIALLFVWFTFFPPEIGLFVDPVSGTYGIERA